MVSFLIESPESVGVLTFGGTARATYLVCGISVSRCCGSCRGANNAGSVKQRRAMAVLTSHDAARHNHTSLKIEQGRMTVVEGDACIKLAKREET